MSFGDEHEKQSTTLVLHRGPAVRLPEGVTLEVPPKRAIEAFAAFGRAKPAPKGVPIRWNVIDLHPKAKKPAKRKRTKPEPGWWFREAPK